MKLNEAEPRRKVVYTPYIGCPDHLKEEGVITTVGTRYVFVRYGNDIHSKATSPEDLEYAFDDKTSGKVMES
ncbi:hypothetical protein SP15_174 [Bacillus phage SP-15]|uniref:Uncharacterized protein n=1 Tax=Bacillus phage SP-15 TaxID=1792032 RepID=A0A127AWK9_9CAUD|nr:hypothetical protein SP15_174 [Bacillus phage SP-15]AMM44972.1 hypothetical protein SP15_174 [Bacillus phage SP-15]